MYRRLMAWSMAIAGVASLAFLIPLGMNVRQYQQDVAMVRAQQEGREVSSYATFVPDANRLVATLRNLDYGSTSPDEIVVWFADGRAVSATKPDQPVGAMPSSVSQLMGQGTGSRPSVASTDGGRELLWPAPTQDGLQIVVRVFVPDSVLHADVVAKWLWLAAVATAIVLAAGVGAGRLGRHIAPPAATPVDAQPVT